MTNQQHADNFVAKYNGKYIDEDKYYGSQCWDVVARYAREEFSCPSFPTTSGGAEGLYRLFSQPIPQYFDKVGMNDLQAGDVVVWNATFYPPWGHTALVWRREGNTIWVLEQDGSKDPDGDGDADGVSYIVQRQITNKVSGGLRPKGGQKMDKQSAKYLAQRIGLLAFMSEAEITDQWLDYHAGNIVADPGYAAALCKQLYEGQQWQTAAWKAIRYEDHVKEAYNKGVSEATGKKFVETKVYIPEVK